jgi:hypothetical protein
MTARFFAGSILHPNLISDEIAPDFNRLCLIRTKNQQNANAATANCNLSTHDVRPILPKSAGYTATVAI